MFRKKVLYVYLFFFFAARRTGRFLPFTDALEEDFGFFFGAKRGILFIPHIAETHLRIVWEGMGTERFSSLSGMYELL